MSRFSPLLLVFAALSVSSAAFPAATEVTFVCYRHKATGAMMFACQQLQGPHDAFPRVYCVDKADQNRKRFKPTEAWETLAAGHPDCQQRQPVHDVPRGDEASLP